MDTGALKAFAQAARRQLMEQVTVRLEYVLSTDSVEIREKEQAVKELRKQIEHTSKEAVIERVAYTWFNRLCALRFMDVNRYTRIGTVSPAEGFTQPEILAEAKQGHISEEFGGGKDRQRILDLLGGRTPSSDPQQEAYRLLLVAVCNFYNTIMPFMFEKIADYTELLMPEDLLSEGSSLHAVREAMAPEVCQDVEVIGWLYQFYISEKKDAVMARKSAVPKEDIPAVTQLFTPHWIVRYLAENSLGRLWMLNHPASRLVDRMDYYIKPERDEPDFLRVSSPAEIRICDPACGSGHMLVYAFDLLYAIYEEQGYDAPDIPRLILRNNLYGIEIDQRAGELAAFALFMKAREKDKRFFHRPVQPYICILESIDFEAEDLKAYMDKIGRDLFTVNLQTMLYQFKEADNFGSLIRPVVTDVADIRRILEEKRIEGNLFLHNTHQRVLKALKQADYLSPKYHVVIANPPYMGGLAMNSELKQFAKGSYVASKSDLFAMFIERGFSLAMSKAFIAMITMQSWMFLSSYEDLRTTIVSLKKIVSMAHLGPRAFDTIGGEVVQSTAFVLANVAGDKKGSAFFRLVDGNSEAEKSGKYLEAIANPNCGWFFHASADDFKKIPGSPIAYWLSPSVVKVFVVLPRFSDFADTRIGLITGDNDRYIRAWHEVSWNKVGFGLTRGQAASSEFKWFPQSKGGEIRKWFGNHDTLVDWSNDGNELQTRLHSSGDRVLAHNFNLDRIFLPAITWTKISGEFSARLQPLGFCFNDASANAFPRTDDESYYFLAFLNSALVEPLLAALNQTLNYLPGNISALPVPDPGKYDWTSAISDIARDAVILARVDWDNFETSWDFGDQPLLRPGLKGATLDASWRNWEAQSTAAIRRMQELEEENNRIFIEAYGLQDELTPEMPLKEITLTCNPHYRYGGDKTEEELEVLLLADTMKEFISYAVGCMFGRYSLDKPGLILANQGETIKAYLTQITVPTFEPDDDNVIPLMEVDWFTDDIAERFKKFLRVTFGEESYEENLSFVEQAIGKDVRKYFLIDFYNDHVKRYRKRPIYWMFSSPNSSFNALIYMHRYRPDTVSVVLNDYLRDFRSKLNARRAHLEHVSIGASASQRDKTAALKEIEKLKKMINEVDAYERDVLYPLATKQIEIDLDDGVKVNYLKFGDALKTIAGLDK